MGWVTLAHVLQWTERKHRRRIIALFVSEGTKGDVRVVFTKQVEPYAHLEPPRFSMEPYAHLRPLPVSVEPYAHLRPPAVTEKPACSRHNSFNFKGASCAVRQSVHARNREMGLSGPTFQKPHQEMECCGFPPD